MIYLLHVKLVVFATINTEEKKWLKEREYFYKKEKVHNSFNHYGLLQTLAK